MQSGGFAWVWMPSEKAFVSSAIQGIVKKLDELNAHYNLAISHIQDVSMPALGYLPKRFEVLKKSIKVAQQVPAEIDKIRDFEYERLENLKLAMLHFFNAKMYLHAKALELGGSCEGPPGLRGEEGPMAFYGAYFRDLDGNKLCAFRVGPA